MKNQDYEHRYRDGKLLCNAKDNTCGGWAMRGKTKCRSHGGSTPSGPASPNYKHGRRSRWLPARIAEKYKAAINDPELAECRHSIAVLSLRADELLESGESHLLWSEAQKAFNELDAVRKNGDAEAINAAWFHLRDLIRRGREDSLRWREWYEVTEREGRMKEREWKRIAQLQASISAEEFMGFINQLVEIASRTITNLDDLKRFKSGVDDLWQRDSLEPRSH